MDTTNPVPTDAFIGIDPDDTLTVPYGGAIFTLGVMPLGLWDRLNARFMTLQQTTRRLLIKRLKDEGRDPDSMVDERLALIDLEALRDDSFRAGMFEIQHDAAKFGVRKHDGFKVRKKNGTEIEVPLKFDKKIVDGFPCEVLADSTMKYYHAQPMLLTALWIGLRKLHTLGEETKKA